MTKFLLGTIFCAIILFLAVESSEARDIHVDGYYRSNGTYVEPHYRSRPKAPNDYYYGNQGSYNQPNGTLGNRVNNYGNGGTERKTERDLFFKDNYR